MGIILDSAAHQIEFDCFLSSPKTELKDLTGLHHMIFLINNFVSAANVSQAQAIQAILEITCLSVPVSV